MVRGVTVGEGDDDDLGEGDGSGEGATGGLSEGVLMAQLAVPQRCNKAPI